MWSAGLLNVKEKEMTIYYIMNMCFERRESKCFAVLIKYFFPLAQQLKRKNTNVLPGQLFCRLCKVGFLLETD